jgi:ATP-dependent DNA helicase RecG
VNDSELAALLTDGESDRVERKASIASPDRVAQAICAFANDLPNHRKPGVVFVGVNDDGSCAGLPITDDLLLTLADYKSNGNIHPFPSIVVEKRTIQGCTLAAVTVQPSEAPPVRFKGVVWIRVGPRRETATEEELRRLSEKRRSRNIPYDLTPVADASQDDLDADLFCRTYLPASVSPETLAGNCRDIVLQMQSLRFLSSGPDVRPTVVGLLVCGVDPREYVPGAYVQFIRFDGDAITDPIKDQKEVGGPLPDVVRILEEVIEANIATSLNTSGLVHVPKPDYPVGALKQLVRNALLHRTYEGTHAPVRVQWFTDRIEIHSPGGPFGQVTRENFGRPGIADYRNPSLSEAMKNLGYVQRFGIGIALARKELADNMNPELAYQVEETHVLATVRRRR